MHNVSEGVQNYLTIHLRSFNVSFNASLSGMLCRPNLVDFQQWKVQGLALINVRGHKN